MHISKPVLFPEYQFNELSPEQFRGSIIEMGAAMLRKAIDPQLLLKYSDSLTDLFLKYSAISPSDFEQRLNNPDPAQRDFWEQIKLSHIFDRTFKSLAGYSYFDIARTSGLWNLIARAFPESTLAESAVCNSRRVSNNEPKQVWDTPIEFHIDAQFFYDHMLSINFWTPLVACGIDAPGVKVILLGVSATKNYLEYNPGGYEPQSTDFARMNRFRCFKMEVSALQEHDMLRYVWAPAFSPGDVLAFTNFTMHATHHTKSMMKPRTSVEVRIDLPSVAI